MVKQQAEVSASNLVNSLKGVSSRMIRKNNYPSIRKKLSAGALWSRRMRRNMNTTSHQRPFTSWPACPLASSETATTSWNAADVMAMGHFSPASRAKDPNGSTLMSTKMPFSNVWHGYTER